MSTQQGYDNDCNIIKQPITVDELKIVVNEFRSQIELLKDENKKLQKDIELLKNQTNDSIINKLAIPKLDFDIDEEDVEKRYSDLIKWFIEKLPSKIKINIDFPNQFKIPLEICENGLNKNNNYWYPKMDLQIYLKRRNINIRTSYNNCNGVDNCKEVEVYYSFII